MKYVDPQPYLLGLFSCFLQVFGVPHPYCNTPLNKADCNEKPTPVLTYYKPGSRCEVDYWRGCPTVNKFANEYECSDLCIGKIQEDLSPAAIKEDDPCQVPIDRNDCNKIPKVVYSFDSALGRCVPTVWKGCPSANQFDAEDLCVNTCENEVLSANGAQSFEDQLSTLGDDQLEEINSMMKGFEEHEDQLSNPDHEAKKVEDVDDNNLEGDVDKTDAEAGKIADDVATQKTDDKSDENAGADAPTNDTPAEDTTPLIGRAGPEIDNRIDFNTDEPQPVGLTDYYYI